jgi:hypothetical protein
MKNSGNLSPYAKFDQIFELMLQAFGIEKVYLVLKIEHYTCGYLGELRNFQNKAGFQCPKCKRILTQEGVDFQIKTD